MRNRNFNEIYQRLLNEKDPVLDILHKRQLVSSILVFVALIVFLGVIKYIEINMPIICVFMIVEIISISTFLISSMEYRNLYKQAVISKMIKAYDSGLNFDHRNGMGKAQYIKADFGERFDKFKSEDLIYGTIDNEFSIKMSEVKVEREQTITDSDGNIKTDYVTVFQGLFGIIDVSNKFLPYFEVRSNKAFGKYDNNRIEVDSAEFEKYYDLYTDDKIRTMEIFTSEVIERFNNLKYNLNFPIQVKVKNGLMFFRVKMDNSFEAPTFGNALDFKSMYHNFSLINEPVEIFSKIFENAKNVL